MSKNIYIVISVGLAMILGATVLLARNQSSNQQVLATESTSNSEVAVESYSTSDITAHNNQSDCWMSIEGKVYNVTDFISRHPGGSRILQGCGKDASDLFSGAGGHIHSQIARALLADYQIGELVN